MIIILGYLIFVDTEKQRILAEYDNNIVFIFLPNGFDSCIVCVCACVCVFVCLVWFMRTHM